jgi:putative ABC transport system permease protein
MANPNVSSPLVSPRIFSRCFASVRDSATAPLVGIIDERLAASLGRNDTAIGKRFQVALPGQPPASGQVVGVVGNIRHQRLDNDDDRQVYFSYHQFTDGRIALVVRSQSDVRPIAPAVVQTIHNLDPEQPVYDVGTMDDVLARSAAERWLNTAIIGTFATCALLLAGVGFYGVIAYGVTQRVREFGLRIAVGAAPSRISRLVLVEGLMLAGTGTTIGLGAAVALSKGMRKLLYGVTPLDPLSVASATAVLLVVALVASYLPAETLRRA